MDPKDDKGRFEGFLCPVSHHDIFALGARQLNKGLRVIFIVPGASIGLCSLTQETAHSIACALAHQSTVGCSGEDCTQSCAREKSLRINLFRISLATQRHSGFKIYDFKS
eukprot:Skav211423  [mRNA]  locus=scaffold1608:285925:292360:- [translate_table: standard]